MRLLRMSVTMCSVVTGVGLSFTGQRLAGQDLNGEAWKLEAKGDASVARDQLRRAAENAPNDPLAVESYAVFLDRHRDPAAREVYQKLSDLLARNRASASERARIARRLATLDLIAGDRDAAARHLEDYRSASGTGLTLASAAPPAPKAFIEIPGPLRSFGRMAAVTPDSPPEDLLAALARNIMLNGYSATHGSDALEPTEYLKLLQRYLSQAREIEKLAGPSQVVRIEMCESAETGDVLRVLGYRMRGGCGSDVVLETVNASRAFITIDSGFPLSDLEQALRTNRPFSLDYHRSRIPILFGTEYWTQDAGKKDNAEFIDYFLSDPTLCRLYSAMSALDPDTADQIRKDMPAQKAKVYAHVLDFFGGMFEIRGGKVTPPGGARSEKAWADLVGVPPERGAAFIERLFAKDDGWLASYYDALARIGGPVQDYLTEPDRLKRYYAALRGRVTSPGPARPVFRSSTDLVLLTARLRLNADGRPHLPGGLEVWKNMFAGKTASRYDPRLAKAALGWKEPEEVVEAFFGLAKKIADNEPLKIFMALTDVERNRTKPLEAATVDALVRDYRLLGSQYSLLADVPALSDSTILAFLEAARANAQMKDISLRTDAAGTLQALAAFWQIFARQGNIAPTEADAAFAAVLKPFAKIQNSREIFDAGEKGVRALLDAAHAPATGSPQDHVLDLLAGTKPTAGADLSEAQQQMLQDMTRAFEAQRLVSLETLFSLADRLDGTDQKTDPAQTAKLAARISEIQLPRGSLTIRERTEMSVGYWNDRHIDFERKTNLRALIDKAGSDPQKLRDVRGALAPHLRDTLVGLVYIHYAPPGAQILYTNPLFVRNHDFFGAPDRQRTWSPTDVFGNGWPANAGGRLVGSLSALPYALAEAEQNFLIPSREQALIWGDLVPQMMQAAVIPRFWNVTPAQLHWVGLHMSYAETALAEAALDSSARQRVVTALNPYVPPARLRKVETLLASGDVRAALDHVVPSEMYLITSVLAPADRDSGIAGEIRELAAEAPEELSPRVISHAFGTPKPVLTNSYQPELLNLRAFPTLMGYSSRILAETWESNLLFYAALADQVHIHPAELNLLVPGWTQQTVERIFATHLEDWPALLRSLRQVGDDVVQKARKQVVAAN
ncbi:MAG TPA: hypothetical protein VGR73_17585 [Bryobacteraceae bacterium]|nr:hypothetical protein [Bryobacteraceae bacterium]